MGKVVMSLVMAFTLAFCFFYDPPADGRIALIHAEVIHVVEPWENAEEIAKKYLPFNKEFDNVGVFAAAIRRANGFTSLVPGKRIVIPVAYEKK